MTWWHDENLLFNTPVDRVDPHRVDKQPALLLLMEEILRVNSLLNFQGVIIQIQEFLNLFFD